MINFSKKFKILGILFLSGVIFSVIAVMIIIYIYGRDLPDHESLAKYEPPVTSRLYAADGKLIDEFSKEKRLFVPLSVIPNHIRNAFLAAEDSNFYNHNGVDPGSLLRAAMQNVTRIGKGKNFIGGSTITQQVVKNILLTKERTITRKIKEAILAIRLSKVLSKDRVLELYLNKIYLGHNSYGIAAAALNYFNKSLDKISIEEAAFMAALPKAPSTLDPKKNYSKALNRRNWVIKRMAQDGFITKNEAKIAKDIPIILRERDRVSSIHAGSFSETVRKKMIKEYGEDELMEGGMVILSTLDPKIQEYSFNALRKGLHEYDIRHGYRGPITRLDIKINKDKAKGKKGFPDWLDKLDKIERPANLSTHNWDIAVVVDIKKDKAKIGFIDSTIGEIKLEDSLWAKKILKKIDKESGKNITILSDEPTSMRQVFKIGDVIIVKRKPDSITNEYLLEQMPEVNGAIVVMNPHNGAVLAMVGGYNDSKVEFNRAVQAMRQPGSILKPFTYITALENNYAPNTIMVDDEVRMKKEDGTYWIPMNYSHKFYGPTPLRMGLERSRNVVTVRLAEMVGLNNVAKTFQQYNIYDNLLTNYAEILGAKESNLLTITSSYAMIANGGKEISPNFIEKIQNKEGKVKFSNAHKCNHCTVDKEAVIEDIVFPKLTDDKKQLSDPRSIYQMISMLQGVIKRGTGWRAKVIKNPVAGKTGTTNDSFDAWFVGFSADLVVGVWVGYDSPKSLGKHETGSSVTVPIFIDIMQNALKNKSARPFKVPEGIKFAKIDRFTGKPPGPDSLTKDIIFEVFKSENFDKLNNPNIDQNESDDINNKQEDLNYESTIY